MNQFGFNTEKFDFWPIYEAIKKYYPIGITSDSHFYGSYPGFIELTNILVEYIHEGKNPIFNWQELLADISENTKCEVRNTTYGQQFCYSASLIFETSSHNHFTHQNQIHFFISLIGPFYTIIGESENELVVNDGDYLPRFSSTNYFVASPYNEFSTPFSSVEEVLKRRLPGYKFVPYWIHQQQIDGLILYHQDENKRPSIFNILFNDHIRFIRSFGRTLGNHYYGNEAWIRPEFDAAKAGVWSIFPPSSAFSKEDEDDIEE